MVHQKLVLAGVVVLLLATSCSVSPVSNITETVPALIPTTDQPVLPMQDPVTETVSSVTAATLIDTPSASPTEPSMLISTVPPEIAGEHHVSSGETLSCISRAYGVLPNAIADANGLEVISTLNAGQVLRIPRIPWINIPAGETCRPQFSPPFPTLSAPSPIATTLAPPPTWTSTLTGDVPTVPATTAVPSATNTSEPPTIDVPPTNTSTSIPSALTSTAATIHIPPTDTPTFNPSPVGPGADTPMPPLPFPSLILVTFGP